MGGGGGGVDGVGGSVGVVGGWVGGWVGLGGWVGGWVGEVGGGGRGGVCVCVCVCVCVWVVVGRGGGGGPWVVGGGSLGGGVLGVGSHPGWYRDKVLARHGTSIMKERIHSERASGSAGKRGASKVEPKGCQSETRHLPRHPLRNRSGKVGNSVPNGSTGLHLSGLFRITFGSKSADPLVGRARPR